MLTCSKSFRAYITSRTVALCLAVVAMPILLGLAGCKRLREAQHDKVYVSARSMYLHDRVAAVSNRVGQVTNGQPLEVLERGRRFLRVKTEKNEIGWIEEHAVIDSKLFDAFTELGVQHKQDPVIATAVLRDDIYLHLTPGRDTERFLLLPANAKLQLLARASVPKTAPGAPRRKTISSGAAAANGASVGVAKTGDGAAKTGNGAAKPGSNAATKPVVSVPAPTDAAPVLLEDWWLVRDSAGHAGWLLSGRIDVDVPDEIAQYAEGQRIVGAYLLAKVTDEESSAANHEVPEYVTVLSPPKAGLPFDFDQVRVFTWSLKRHRYETAFRAHPIQGYFPVTVTRDPGNGGGVPTFSFKVGSGENMSVDAETGIARPANLRTINYQMIETTVKRVGPDLGPLPTGRPAEAKAAKAVKAHQARKKSR